MSRRRARPHVAEAGWNSWYELWDAVDEEAVRANATRVAALLGPLLPDGAPPLRIVIDDGWQRGWGDWEPNAKFPSGLDGLAVDLKAQGFAVGVWLAPLLVEESSPLVAAHPEWFVDGAQFQHLKIGRMRVLDVTHPEAAAHLAGVIARVVGWGYDLLKIDFLFAGTFAGERHEDVTGMEAYTRALEVIREAAGDAVFLLAVGAPSTPTLAHVDGWRVGPDIAVEPFGAVWALLPNALRTIGARWPWCLATLCDGDPAILRDLEREEVATGGFVAAAAGGALFLSDDLRTLDDERVGWGIDEVVMGLALGGRPAVPEDAAAVEAPEALVSGFVDHVLGQSTHVVPAVWRLPGGARVGVNMTDAALVIEGVMVPPRATRYLPGAR